MVEGGACLCGADEKEEAVGVGPNTSSCLGARQDCFVRVGGFDGGHKNKLKIRRDSEALIPDNRSSCDVQND